MQTFFYLYCVYIYISAKILYYAKQNKKKKNSYMKFTNSSGEMMKGQSILLQVMCGSVL